MVFLKYLSLTLLLISLLHIGLVNSAMAQQEPRLPAVQIKDTLEQIGKRFQVNFIYEASLLTHKVIIQNSKAVPHRNLELILSALLAPIEISYYRIDGENYALFKSPQLMQKQQIADRAGKGSGEQLPGFSVSGFVRNTSGQALEFSSITLLDSNSLSIVTMADALGNYKFEKLKEGRYMIRATRLGYKAGTWQSLQLTGAKYRIFNDLQLTEDPIQLEQLAVQPVGKLIRYQADRTIIHLSGAFPNSSASIKDLLNVSPGVIITDDLISLNGKQGTLVMINGSSVKLTPMQTINLMGSIPLSSVSQVELIHGPSARYEAQTTGGVINIKVAEAENDGLEGTISSQFSIGTRPKFTESAALNYKSGKINIYGNYSYQNQHNAHHFSSFNTIEGLNPVYFQQDERGETKAVVHQSLLAVTYRVNPEHNMTLTGTANLSHTQTNYVRKLMLPATDGELVDSAIHSVSGGNERLRNYGLSINSSHNFAGGNHSLQFNASYARFRSGNPVTYQNAYRSASDPSSGSEEQLLNQTGVALELATGGIDYTWKINTQHLLEAGGKIAYTHSNSRILFTYEKAFADFSTNYTLTNIFEYQERINAGYINYKGTFGSATTFQAGIRAEQTRYNIDTTSIISGDVVNNRNYTQFFPNLMLSQYVGQQLITLAYRRQVGRPNYQDLNPFITYFSPYSYAVGNQNLKPETTQYLEIGYHNGYAWHLGLTYSHTNDYLSSIISLENRSFSTRENIGNFGQYNTINFSAAYQQELLHSWQLIANVRLFHDRYQSVYLNTEQALSGFYLHVINSYQVNPKIALEIVNLYQSRRAQLTGTDFGRYRADAALKYSFIKNRASIRIAVSDIFSTYLNNGSMQFQQLNRTYRNWDENRRFLFGLSFNLKNRGVKATQVLRNQEELNRIKP